LFWGDLKECLFPQVLYFLKKQGLGGTLYLRSGRAVKAVKIEEGEPAAVKTTLAREGFLRYLWDKKRVTAKKLAEIGRADDPFAEAVSREIIPESSRLNVLRELYLLRLLDVFGWRSGEFLFWPAFLGGEWETKTKAPVSVGEVIVRGTIARSSPGFLFNVMKQKLELPFKIDRLAFYESSMVLPERYEPILGVFESSSSLSEILKDGKTPRKDVLRLAAILYSVGALRFEEPDEIREEHSVVEEEVVKPPKEVELTEYAHTIEKSWSTMKDLDYFSLLDVRSHVPFSDLQARYDELALKFRQPGLYRSASDEVKKKADELSDRLADAYRAVRSLFEQFDRGRHTALRTTLEALTSERVARVRAEVHFIQGLQHVDANNFGVALEHFTEACRIRPQEGEYWAYRGYANCRYTNSLPNKEGEIADSFRRAREIDPYNHMIYYLEADAYCAAGELESGKKCLRSAAALRPSSKRVSAKLKLVESQLGERAASDGGGESKAMGVDRDALEEKINAMLKRCRNDDLYEVLGLKEELSPGDVRKAYLKLVKEYHPDVLGSKYPDLKRDKRLREIVQKLQAAFEILTDPKKLSDYHKFLKAKIQMERQKKLERKSKRELDYKRAIAMISEGHYKAADELLEELYSESQELRFQVYGIWAKFLWEHQNDRADVDEYAFRIAQLAREYEEKAEKDEASEKDVALIYLIWGKIYKKMSEYSLAFDRFSKAAKLDPLLSEAHLEKRITRVVYQRKKREAMLAKEGLVGYVKYYVEKLKEIKLF